MKGKIAKFLRAAVGYDKRLPDAAKRRQYRAIKRKWSTLDHVTKGKLRCT